MYGVLNGDMYNSQPEPGERCIKVAGLTEPDYFDIHEFAYLMDGRTPEQYAEDFPWMIIFEVSVSELFENQLW